MAQIALFGMGTMGLPIAKNLLRAGYGLTTIAYSDVDKTKAVELKQLGAVLADRAYEVVDGADFILSIVPADAAVKAIYLNETVRSHIKTGAIIIEMTSCTPQTIVDVQAYYAGRGVGLVDAPVTGGVHGAINGQLTIIGAGDPADFACAESVFSVIAQKVYQLGPVGNGKRVKAMTNLLGAINLAAVGEFYRSAKAANLDMDLLAEVVVNSAGGSTQFNRNFKKIVDTDFSPAFTLALLRKDMGIAMEAAHGVFMPLGECAYRLFQKGALFDHEDCSAIAKVDK